MLVKTLFNRMEKFKSFVFSKAWIDDSKGKVRIVLEPNRSFPPRRDPSRKKVMTTETSGVWEKFMKVSCFRSRREESGTESQQRRDPHPREEGRIDGLQTRRDGDEGRPEISFSQNP